MSIFKLEHQPPAAFGTNEELNAIIERMAALMPIELSAGDKMDRVVVQNLDNAYLKGAQLSVFYRLIPSVDIHIIRFGKAFAVDCGVSSWQKAADRYCALHNIAFHAIYEEMTPDEVKIRRGSSLYDVEDVAYRCYIWRSDKQQVYDLFGGKSAMTCGFGSWVKKARYNQNKQTWEPDNIPVQRTKDDVARRRALKAALKMEFSLDSLLAAAPNEVREQLAYLDMDAKAELRRTAPVEVIRPEVTEDGFIVTAGTPQKAQAPSQPVQGQGYADDEDFGLWVETDDPGEAEDEPGDNDEIWTETVVNQTVQPEPEDLAKYRRIAEKLTGAALTLRDWSRQYHADSQGEADLTPYRVLVGELEALVGKGNHRLLLGVLLGRMTNSDSRPGEKFVNFLTKFLTAELTVKDAEGKSVKGPNKRVLKEPNPVYSEKFHQAVLETWAQVIANITD